MTPNTPQPPSLTTPCGKTVKPGFQLAVVDTAVTEANPKGHRPLRCRAHVPCRELYYSGGTTADIELVHAVRDLHPDTTVGASPGKTLLCLDFDDRDRLREFLKATQIRKGQGNLVVESPRLLHFWFTVPETFAKEDVVHRAGLDVRTDGWGSWEYVMAPETTRGDGQTYSVIEGTWGAFPDAPPAVIEYLTSPSTPPLDSPCGKTVKPRGVTPKQAADSPTGVQHLPDALIPAVLARMDAHALVDHKDRSEACYAAINILLGYGLTPAAHHQFALTYRPKLMDKVWRAGDYSPKSLTRQANKAAATFVPASGEQRLAFDGTAARIQLLVHVKGDLDHNLVQLHQFLVEQVNLRQKDTIGVGVQELTERFGISKPTASAWLKRLAALGLTELVEEYVWDPHGRADRNRVRRWRVLHLDVTVR